MPVHVVSKKVHYVGICYRLRYIARTVCTSLSCHHKGRYNLNDKIE